MHTLYDKLDVRNTLYLGYYKKYLRITMEFSVSELDFAKFNYMETSVSETRYLGSSAS
eukprot:SAG31_NODE_4318_length_3362_cov_17.927061_4_plen_58_part_00